MDAGVGVDKNALGSENLGAVAGDSIRGLTVLSPYAAGQWTGAYLRSEISNSDEQGPAGPVVAAEQRRIWKPV
jgi:hypothetical protein